MVAARVPSHRRPARRGSALPLSARTLVALGASTLLWVTGCPAKEAKSPEPEAADEDGAGDDTKAEGGSGGAAEGAATREAANAAKEKAGETAARVDCPEALKGTDAADRVIGGECGVIPVEGNYAMEGGTLTLEAGASLAFADGATMTVGYYKPSKLVVKGTADKPVVLAAQGDQTAGVWQGLRLQKKANRSEISNLVIRHAGADDDGALLVEADDVRIEGLKVELAKKVGVRVGTEVGFSISGSELGAAEGPAIRSTVAGAHGIASDNRFAEGATVDLDRGKVHGEVTLHRLDVPWVVLHKLAVDGKNGAEARLTVEAGNELRMGPAAGIDVGYYQPARLEVKGSADAPVRFVPQRGEAAGSWGHLAIYGKAVAQLEHLRFERGAADDNRGMLYAKGAARLTLDGAAFVEGSTGLKVDGSDATLSLTNTSFEGTPKAISCSPRVFAGVGAGNRYGEGVKIHLTEGRIEKDELTWSRQAAPVELDGEVSVDRKAKLTIEAGSSFLVEDSVKIGVGYYDRAALVIAGTAEAPVTFAGLREGEQTWGPLTIYGKARANALRHVKFANMQGEAAVVVQKDADLEAEQLACTECEGAILTWDCASKVELSGFEGRAPEGCK